MKLSEFLKQNKIFVVYAAITVIFFGFLMVRHSMKIAQMENKYKKEIEELRSLINVNNIGKSPELEYDIYKAVEDFISLYYGISKNITKEYRTERLKGLMTQDSFNRYDQANQYDNSLDYEVTISNIAVYVDYKNSSKEAVHVCIFYDENTDWTGINTITLHKYWMGVFQLDESSNEWYMNEIVDCQELLTREEFNAFMTDTDISTLELGGDEDADARTKTEENP